MKGFNSKKSKNHKLQHWRSFLSYNNYSRNLLYVHLYLWPYKNGLANLKAQKFVWVSFEVKNQNFCLCYAVCCFVSKSDMMFSFDEKNYNLLFASRHFFLTFFFQSWNVEIFFRKIVSHFCLEKFTGKQFDAKMSVVLKIGHFTRRIEKRRPNRPSHPRKFIVSALLTLEENLFCFCSLLK